MGYDVGDVWMVKNVVNGKESEQKFTGPIVAGYMRAFAGPEGVANGNTFLIDSMSPSIENGFVEFDVTNQSAGRIGFLFRVQDLTSANKKYVAMQYDLGEDWNLVINGGDPITIKGIPALNKGEKHHIRIEYVGENIRMLMDGKEVLNQNFKGANIGEGKIGLRVWGWGTGDNQGKADIDNVVNGYFNAVLLNPTEKYVLRSEAGSYDLPISLSQTSNAFTGLKVGDTVLTEGTDYTVSEDKSVVTLTKEYIASVKDNGTTEISFCFADGFITTFKLQVQGAPEEEVEYTRDFAKGIEGFELVSGSATLAADADKNSAAVTGAQNALIIDQKSPELHNGEVVPGQLSHQHLGEQQQGRPGREQRSGHRDGERQERDHRGRPQDRRWQHRVHPLEPHRGDQDLPLERPGRYHHLDPARELGR